MTDNNLFDNNQPQTSKYDSWDIEALKKKAESADAHIATLEEENKNYRSERQTDARIEEVLARLDQLKQNPPLNPPITSVNQPDERRIQAAEVTKEDVLQLVSSTLEQKQKENQVKANVDRIHKELKQAWGDNYKNILTNKAQEMGINQNFLISMAESHPDAFLKLVLDKTKIANPNVHVPPSSNSVHVPMVGTMNGETYKDFKKAMADNPHLRSDPTFNRRMHEAAEKLGNAFYA